MELGDFEEGNKVSWQSPRLGDVQVQIEMKPGESLENFSSGLRTILSWDEKFYKKLEPMLFKYYKVTLQECGETEPFIEAPDMIWSHVYFGSITLMRYENKCFAQLVGGCDWEEEHGLEIDVDEHNAVIYLGGFVANGFRENPSKPRYGNFAHA